MYTDFLVDNNSLVGEITREDNALWLIFRVEKNLYAISSKFVSSILILSDEIIPLPESPKYIKGVYNLRGSMVPFIEMRLLMGLKSLEQEYQSFIDMIGKRKAEHLHWVEELRRCVEEEDQFRLATNPHKCAFGIWLDSFQSDVNSVNVHLNRINDPHKKLHECAKKAIDCTHKHNVCERVECVKAILEKAEKEYIPQIVSILDECDVVFKSSFQEIGIVLESHNDTIGIIVDEVVSVEKLSCSVYGEEGMKNINKMQYFKGVAERENIKGNILIIDEEELFHRVQHKGLTI